MTPAPMLAVVGDLVEDIIVWHRGALAYATDNPTRIFRVRGGSAANVAAAAASLCPVRFIGRVGEDASGDALVAQLGAIGVDVRVQRGDRTGTIVILVDDSGERTMFPDRGASAELGAIDEAWLDGVGWIHVPLYGFEDDGSAAALFQLADAARARGIRLSIDLSSVALLRDLGDDRVRWILDRTGAAVVFANTEEAHQLGLFDAPVALSVVKAGPDPVTLLAGADVIRVPVPPVDDVADATGAGDAFAAGYIARALDGGAPEECVRAGGERAAVTLRTPGAA